MPGALISQMLHLGISGTFWIGIGLWLRSVAPSLHLLDKAARGAVDIGRRYLAGRIADQIIVSCWWSQQTCECGTWVGRVQ